MMSVGEAPNSSIKEILDLTSPKRQELDMAFSFEHMRIDKATKENGALTLKQPNFLQLKQVLSKMQNDLNNKAWNALYFENHDRSRIPSRWGDDTRYRYESATAFATILHGLKGTPFIFQGEEIGMTNPKYSVDEYEDIDLKRALKSMSNSDRAVIQLKYFEELKLDEIAKVLGENVSTIKSRLYRGLKKLKVELEKDDMKEEVKQNA